MRDPRDDNLILFEDSSVSSSFLLRPVSLPAVRFKVRVRVKGLD